MQDLLQSNVEVSMEDLALSLACKHSFNDCLNLLLTNESFKAKVNHLDLQGSSPLSYTCSNNNIWGTETLLLENAEPNEDRVSIWHAVVSSDNSTFVKLLLQYDADIHLSEDEMDVLMLYAAVRDSFQILKLLLAGGARITQNLIQMLLTEENLGPISYNVQDFMVFLCSTDWHGQVSRALQEIQPSEEWMNSLVPVIISSRSLQNLCRSSIRKCLHNSLFSKVPALPLPKLLTSYILLGCDDSTST